MIATAKPTRCPKCRASVVPDRIAKGPNLQESLDVLIEPVMTTLAYKVDRLHLCCPACHHTWRPRLHERGPIFQLIVWPLLFVGAALGIVVIWLAAIGKLP